jgi:hypothetical protein
LTLKPERVGDCPPTRRGKSSNAATRPLHAL